MLNPTALGDQVAPKWPTSASPRWLTKCSKNFASVKPKLIIDSEVRSHAISVRSNARKLRSTASVVRVCANWVLTSGAGEDEAIIIISKLRTGQAPFRAAPLRPHVGDAHHRAQEHIEDQRRGELLAGVVGRRDSQSDRWMPRST